MLAPYTEEPNIPKDSRLDTPAELPAEFKEWLKRYIEQEVGVLGQNVHAPHLAVNNSYPWLVDIDPFMTAVAHTNWDTIQVDLTNNIYGGQKNSSGVQNDSISFDVVLAAGVWTFELMYSKDTNRGIFTVSLGGTTVGTIDAYAGAPAYNQRSSITGINVREPVKQRLTLTMATKTISSSAYYGSIQHIQLKRTA